MMNPRFTVFPLGHVCCFLKQKESLLITLSLSPSQLIQILRTICSKLFGICYRLACVKGQCRPTLDCGAKTVADTLSRFAFKLINRYKVSISRKAESDFIYMIEFARLAVAQSAWEGL